METKSQQMQLEILYSASWGLDWHKHKVRCRQVGRLAVHPTQVSCSALAAAREPFPSLSAVTIAWIAFNGRLMEQWLVSVVLPGDKSECDESVASPPCKQRTYYWAGGGVSKPT